MITNSDNWHDLVALGGFEASPARAGDPSPQPPKKKGISPDKHPKTRSGLIGEYIYKKTFSYTIPIKIRNSI